MTVREMHYDFKQKLGRIDSQENRDLKVPEIDWKLNEAQEIFIKMIAEPRAKSPYGFEVNTRTINDIRTIVVNQQDVDSLPAVPFDKSSFTVTLPQDYWFLVNINILASRDKCINILMYDSQCVQHDDKTESSPFNRSSFEWRVANYRFIDKGIRIFTDGTFTIVKVGFEYIRIPRIIHNAQDWTGGTYNTLGEVTLTGSQSCELPEGVHREIVDMAVLLAAGDLSLPDTQIKKQKISLTQ